MTTSGSVMSWRHGLPPCCRVMTWLLTVLFLLLMLFCSFVEARPDKHVYMLVYTADGKGQQAGKKLIVGAEEIPAKELTSGTHPASGVQLLSQIQSSPMCVNAICSQLDMQTHYHYSVTGDKGQDKVVAVHTAMVDLGSDWDESVIPHAYLERGIVDEVELNPISVFIQNGDIYPVLETKLPYGSRREVTSLVAGKYTPKQKITTVAEFPEKGPVVINTGKHMHGLAIFQDTTKTYQTIQGAESGQYSEFLLHSRGQHTSSPLSTKMLPAQEDLQQGQQPHSGVNAFDGDSSPLAISPHALAGLGNIQALFNKTIIHSKDVLKSNQETTVEFMVPPDFDNEYRIMGLYPERNKDDNNPIGSAKLTIPKGDPGPFQVKLTPRVNVHEEPWVNFYIGKDKSSLFSLSNNYEVDEKTKSSAVPLHEASSDMEKEAREPQQKAFAKIVIAGSNYKARSSRLKESETHAHSLQGELAKLEGELESANKQLEAQTKKNKEFEDAQKIHQETITALQVQLKEQDSNAVKELNKYETVRGNLEQTLAENASLKSEVASLKAENEGFKAHEKGKFKGPEPAALEVQALKNKVQQLTAQVEKLSMDQTHSATMQPSFRATKANTSSPEEMKCTLIGGMGTGGTCNGKKEWTRQGYVRHIADKHSGQLEVGTTGSCPGCQISVATLLQGKTDMLTFMAHVAACSGFVDGK